MPFAKASKGIHTLLLLTNLILSELITSPRSLYRRKKNENVIQQTQRARASQLVGGLSLTNDSLSEHTQEDQTHTEKNKTETVLSVGPWLKLFKKQLLRISICLIGNLWKIQCCNAILK